MVPLHPALVAEGFCATCTDYLRCRRFSPIYAPDKFGALKGTATKKHGRWVRNTVGITDRAKDPAHAWRHRFEDQARRAGVPQNVTDALLGHLNAMNESEGYERGSGSCQTPRRRGWLRWHRSGQRCKGRPLVATLLLPLDLGQGAT
jgi:hypothetical protein